MNQYMDGLGKLMAIDSHTKAIIWYMEICIQSQSAQIILDRPAYIHTTSLLSWGQLTSSEIITLTQNQRYEPENGVNEELNDYLAACEKFNSHDLTWTFFYGCS